MFGYLMSFLYIPGTLYCSLSYITVLFLSVKIRNGTSLLSCGHHMDRTF